jgi:hypothetical protein
MEPARSTMTEHARVKAHRRGLETGARWTHTRDKVSQPACYRKARVRLPTGYPVPSGAASPVNRAGISREPADGGPSICAAQPMDAEIPAAVQIGGYPRGYHDVRPHWLRKVPRYTPADSRPGLHFIIAAEVENLLFCLLCLW